MIESKYYLSNPKNIPQALIDTNLSQDELAEVVGIFKPHSSRAGSLRGEVVKYFNGKVIIRHHFTKKVLWEE